MTKTIWLIGPKAWNPQRDSWPLATSPEHIVYIDGGLAHQTKIKNLGFQDILAVSLGDGDSLPKYLVEQRVSLDQKYPPEKDQSDFSLALSFLRENYNDGNPALSVHLFGLFGGRRDHELAIFGEAYHFLKDFPESSMNLFDENGYHKLSLFHGDKTFSYKGTFSLFSLEKCSVDIEGKVKYGGKNIELLPFQSLGLSNFAKGEFKVASNSPLLIYWVQDSE